MKRTLMALFALFAIMLTTAAPAAMAQGEGGNEFCPEGLLEVDGGKINTVDGVSSYSTPNGVVTFQLQDDKGLVFQIVDWH